MLNTETPSPRHPDLDSYATPALLDAFIADQIDAVAAVEAAAPRLAVDAALPRIRAGGRLLYAGAGTSQKIALNSFSSALMVRLNKVYGNLMVDLKATNAKLVKRALALTVRASGAGEADAQAALSACDHHVKTALVMLRRGVGADAARQLLHAPDGSASKALSA